MRTPQQLPEHLKTISRSDWNKLFSFLPKMQPEKLGKLVTGKKSQDGNLIPPYTSTYEVMHPLQEVIDELELIVYFDWPGWKEGIDIIKNENSDYSACDAVTLCKFLTCIQRGDRFSQGLIAKTAGKRNYAEDCRGFKERDRCRPDIAMALPML